MCKDCKYRFVCKNCSTGLVEYRSSGQLICHHCMYTIDTPNICKSCKSENSLLSYGIGVERVHDEVSQYWAQAKIKIVTTDTMQKHSNIEEYVHDADIIIGTQVIAKGYNFPRLTLVAILDADAGMIGGDFRVNERMYQIIHQVGGRAGRFEDKGTVVIQTSNPQSQLFKSLSNYNCLPFYERELSSRQQYQMPPYGKLVAVTVSGKSEKQTESLARALVNKAPILDDVTILGPVPAPIVLLRNNFRYRILLKCNRSARIGPYVQYWFGLLSIPRNIKVTLDVDPYSFM